MFLILMLLTLLMSFFDEQNLFIFIKSNLLIFSFAVLSLCPLKNICLSQGYKDVLCYLLVHSC